MTFEYSSDEQFLTTYKSFLPELKVTDEQIDEILTEVRHESSARHQESGRSLERKVNIVKNYTPLDRKSFVLSAVDYQPLVANLLRKIKQRHFDVEEAFSIVEPVPGLQEVYTLPLLTAACLHRINAELDAFLASGLPVSRPNTMNRQGILLCELPGHMARAHPESPSDPGGADVDLIGQELIFPDIGGKIDSYRAFTVEYEGQTAADLEVARDSGLAYHYDNAELTVNICLRMRKSSDKDPDPVMAVQANADAGGEICFAHSDPYWIMHEPCPPAALVPNQPGWALLHRGSHVHGAQPLAPGYVRRNLIVWLRSTSVRNSRSPCPRCKLRPNLVPLPYWLNGQIVEGKQPPSDQSVMTSGFGDGFWLEALPPPSPSLLSH
nr:unnamed protein product [Spirometra erinaceieuropaei]